jgi:hypothetical protein
MANADREAREDELEARSNALNERLDRFFAFQLPIDASLEERIQNLERRVTFLSRLVTLQAIIGGPSRMRTLERIERALDEAEGQQPNGS